ncbi:tag [Mytilus edulis]|uniref:Tag n=1 Tax=Mytilus edulis TaxID=6550 RepID=A0A8S3PR28_MYTED|nr:tag [Mytilus edulis]
MDRESKDRLNGKIPLAIQKVTRLNSKSEPGSPRYFTMIVCMILSVGTSVYRNVLKKAMSNIKNFEKALLPLEPRFNNYQKSILFPKEGTFSGDLNDLNMETMYIVLKRIGNFKPHSKGWGALPEDDDHSTSANLDRIELIRAKTIGRCVNTNIKESEFKTICQILINAMIELDACFERLGDVFKNTYAEPPRMGQKQTRKSSYTNKSSGNENEGEYSGNLRDLAIPTLYSLCRCAANIPPHDQEWGNPPNDDDCSLMVLKLPIVCDGLVVDCIIDKRLEHNYKSLEKIIKKRELSIMSGRPPGACDQIFETEQIDMQHFIHSCEFLYDNSIRLLKNFTVLYLPSNVEFEKLFIFQKVQTSRKVNIKGELHNSIEAHQMVLCRYILINFNKSVMCPLLEEALDKAINTKRRNTIKAMSSQIIKCFYQIHEKVFDRRTSIWLGIECTCGTSTNVSYEDCLYSSTKPKIIIESYPSDFKETFVDELFHGFSIRIIETNSKEARFVAKQTFQSSGTQFIEEIYLHDDHNPSETSIDAALAVIKTGDLSMFNIANDDTRRQCCTDLGLSSCYLNNNAIDPVTLRNAKAFCGISGNQMCDLKTAQKNILVRTGTHIQSRGIKMYNQVCIYGMKFQEGDSGTCVYVHTPGYNRLTGCIGMLIGMSTCGNYVLTPMKEILKIFDL